MELTVHLIKIMEVWAQTKLKNTQVKEVARTISVDVAM